MKAAFYEGKETISVGAAEEHKPGQGEVRVQVAYCGICGTDLHIYAGDMDKRVKMPHIAGHEMSGTIAEVGPDAGDWRVGQRVVVRPIYPCNECPACLAGHSHVCQKLKFMGIDTPGALQGFWTVPAFTLHALPDSVKMDMGALVEPVAVACHVIRLSELAAGEFAVVIGGGPIGALVALVAREAGARVVMAEVNPARLERVRAMGLEAVDPREVDLVAMVEQRTGTAGADAVYEVSGSQPGVALMTQLCRVRGRLVIVATYAYKPEVDLYRIFWREMRLMGTRVYEPEDFERAIELVAGGSLPLEQLITDRLPLEETGAAFGNLASGKAFSMKTLIDVGGSQ